MNTAIREMLIESTVKPISSAPLRAACIGFIPDSTWRAMFSITTIASSTTKPLEIASAISEAQAARAQATGVTAELVLRELARLAFGDARAIFNGAGELRRPEDWPDDLAAAIASVEVVTASRGEGVVEHVAKIKLWDKGRALELLARHLGMLNDKIKLEAGEGLAETLIKARKRRRGAE